MSILRPDASVTGLPFAGNRGAPKGFTLGEHIPVDDDLDGKSGGVPRLISGDPTTHRFEPYMNNGGTVVAVSGKDYSIVASDTRFGLGYAVPARYVSRIMKMTDKVVLASGGMQTDIATLHKMLRIRLVQYKAQHKKDMSLTAISQMLSNTLYYRRFQPYYTFNVLGGLDDNGDGWCYGYDAIGSHEKVRAVCSGTGQSLLQPVLDNQVEFRQTADEMKPKDGVPLDTCVELVKDSFTSAGERDIYTGDTLEIFKITKSGVEIEKFDLKKD